MRIASALLLVLNALGTGCLGESFDGRALVAALGPPERVVIRDVAVFTATSDALLEHQDVVLEAGLISALHPTGEPLAAGARVIEGAGRTLLPGLVDTHVHLTAPGSAPWQLVLPSIEHNSASQLYAGVTTVYDLSGMSSDIRKMRERIEGGDVPGPRIYLTDSSISQKGGHPLPAAKELLPWVLGLVIGNLIVQVEDLGDVEKAVERIAENKVDYLKIILDDLPPGTPVLDEETLRALIDEGHRRGMFVFVHIGTAAQAVLAAKAGADALAHMPYRDELSEDQARTIAAEKVPIIATLDGFVATDKIAQGTFTPSAFDREMHPSSWLDPVTGEKAAAKVREAPTLNALMASVRGGALYWKSNLQRLHAAGATILVGSDSPLPGIYPGSGLHHEMAALVEHAGLPPSEVLLGATSRAAALFVREPSFGTVAPGKVADLLLIEGDPLVDIRATERIIAVFRAGREVQRNVLSK